jgi:hypothetical protein
MRHLKLQLRLPRAVEEARRHSQRLGDPVEETLKVESAIQAKATRAQRVQSLEEAQEHEVAAGRLELIEANRERRRQKEAAASSVPAVPGAPVPVMDTRFCISHLDAIRSEAGDFTLKDFSNYWAPDNKMTTTNN